MTVLVTGVRGGIGGRVLDRLTAAGIPARGTSKEPAGPGIARLDLAAPDPADLAAALDGVDRVFLYTQPGGIDAFVDAAREAGVELVVQLSSSAVRMPDAATNSIARRHREVEAALAASGLGHTVLHPHALAHNCLAWAPSIRERRTVEIPYPDARLAFVDPDDVARVAVEVLRHGGREGESLYLTGPETLSHRDQAGVLAEVLGHPISVRALSDEEARSRRPSRIPPAVFDEMLASSARAVTTPPDITATIEEVTGVPAGTFREWAVRNRARF
ncbi:MAG TPA: NAD(P)H-binding protein [Phytomonospora sp.]